MANLGTLLKAEISRVARREVRGQIEPLRKSLAAHRTENAALKRRAEALEKEVKRLSRSLRQPAPVSQEATEDKAHRFSAKGLAAQRKRLGLSAADCGLLLGTSGQSVYNWESGSARPQTRHFAALAEFRRLGKRAALGRLEALKTEA